MLLRVPGIGVRGARSIVKARRQTTLGEAELKRLGIALKRARYFVTCNGAYLGRGVDFSREGLHAVLASPIDGGRHGRRADAAMPGQLSLFDGVGSAALPQGGQAREALPAARAGLPASAREPGKPRKGAGTQRTPRKAPGVDDLFQAA